MLRLNSLKGRAVVELESAEKLGQIEEVILDPERQCIAGMIVGRSQGLFSGGGGTRVLPASALEAIGPDAVTVHNRLGDEAEQERIESLPRTVGLVGRKVVSHSGRLLGLIEDVLVDVRGKRILGYALERSGDGPGLKSIFEGRRKDSFDYIRADTDFRLGTDLVVVPDDAVVHASEHYEASDSEAPAEAEWERRPQTASTTATSSTSPHAASMDANEYSGPADRTTLGEETVRITPR